MKQVKYIILSTHLMDLAESLCDDIFLINNGKEILSGNLNQILQNSHSKYYLVKHSNKLSNEAKTFLNNYILDSSSENEFIVSLQDNSITDFIKKANESIDLIEFFELKPNLHKIFLDNVERQNS